MVKIDSRVLSLEQKEKLFGSAQGYFDGKSVNRSKPENRYRILHSLPENRCDKCLFSIVLLIIKYPVVSLIIFTLFLSSLVFVGPVICYAKCLLFNSIDSTNGKPYPDICTYNNPLFVDSEVNTDKYKQFDSIPMWNECKNVPDEERFDCFPESNNTWSDRFQCYLKGCCWSIPKNGSVSAPYCFYPPSFESYEFINSSTSDVGSVAFYELARESKYPNNIPLVKIDFMYRTEDILEVKIYDPINPRYETPYPELPPMEKSPARNPKYNVEIDKSKFGFRVVRKSNNQTIFDTMNIGGFIFSDQFLQISAKLPSKYLYGLGQQRNNFLLDINWKKITLFNHDQPPVDGSNLYGSHPFYLAMETEGRSDGVLLLNSNAMDIILTPAPAITYRAIGGVLDFFFFLGPSPTEVIQQYTELVGRPFLPPYWSLGFHLCRFGYKTLNDTIKVWNRTRNAWIPFDTQWNDLDYMENGNDFTYDNNSYNGLPEFVDLLHKEGMHYMVLVDPGISAGELPGQYPPYDEGIAQSVFVTDSTGYRPLVGKVWNKKSTVFVDFFKPAAVYYWLQQLKKFHAVVPFDGAWIDMNDPSNFVDGSLGGCGNSSLEFPPYVPAVAGGQLRYRTICMSARHYGSTLNHYDVHNVYGLAEAIVTSFSMQQIRGKRPFVISRSSFPGHGKYAGVWTGDINSTWDDMAHSISDILSFSLFGIPMVGADICGFNGNATAELCNRWSQLGAFYPFSRNHNSDLSSDQDPVAMGPKVVRSAATSLGIRYTLLPYLYTLFWHAHNSGETVARPMFLEFPKDINTYALDAQFMWGPALLIVPILKENATKVKAYLPAGQWYNFYVGNSLNITTGMTVTLPDTFIFPESVSLLCRGGYVIPMQDSDRTTTRSRLKHMNLIISLNERGQAEGDLYWDDGDTLAHNDGEYNYIKFMVGDKRLLSEVVQWRYNTTLVLANISVFGAMDQVTQVFVNNILYDSGQFIYSPYLKLLGIKSLRLDISKNIEITWK